MEETFKIRAYGYGELAQLYFPNVTKKSASVQLRRWILKNEFLHSKLKGNGFQSCQKILTPLQVAIVIEHLGEP